MFSLNTQAKEQADYADALLRLQFQVSRRTGEQVALEPIRAAFTRLHQASALSWRAVYADLVVRIQRGDLSWLGE